MKHLEVLKRISDLDDLDPKNILAKVVKLMEELGELSECLLMLDGYKYNKKGMNNDEIKAEAKKECADVFMLLMILSKMLGMEFDELIETTDNKLDKWESLIKKKQEEHETMLKFGTDSLKIGELYKGDFYVLSTPPDFIVKQD